MKKFLALFLALVLCLGVLAGCGGDTNTDETKGQSGGDVSIDSVTAPLYEDSDEVVIEMWCPSNTDLEMEGSWLDVAVEKTINATINIHEYESRDQYEILIAEQKIPALTYANAKIHGPIYGPMGAYIDWNEYIDDMPNVKRVLEQYPNLVAESTELDGSMYQLPVALSGSAAIYGWLYRQDIFEKHDLEFPTNQEEFYNVLVELKELYPSSYPFVLRSMSGNMGGLNSFANVWNADVSMWGTTNTCMDFDPETETYYCGHTSEARKECIAFLSKLYKEGLLHPSCLTIDTSGWIESLASNTSFITFDKVDRIPQLTNGAIDANPEYVLSGASCFPMGTYGDGTTSEINGGGWWLVSALIDDEHLEQILTYIDWLYSPEGIEVTSWGIEGESFELDAEGNKQFLEVFADIGSDHTGEGYTGSGLGVNGYNGYCDFNGFLASVDDNVVDALHNIGLTATDGNDPILSYNDEEQDIWDTYYQAFFDKALSYAQAFIMGEKDIEADWDEYIAALEALHMEELLEIHQAAYDRIYGE